MAIDDRSRLPYVEVRPDQTGGQCAAILAPAAAWLRPAGSSAGA
ncbi:MAG: hypothetical protein AB7M05_20785 [Alphaproteobacteria bacterium]